MKKEEIIKEIAKKTSIETTIVGVIVESYMRTIKEKLLDRKTIYLRGFGSFGLKKKAAKKARIIHKNETIIIPEHFAPSFKPSKIFRTIVKNIK